MIGRALRMSLVVAALGALATVGASAQDRGLPTRAWLAVGVAAGSARGVDAGAGPVVEAVVQRPPHHVAVRRLNLGEVASFPDGGDDSVDELALLYGRGAVTSWGHASIAVGVSSVRVRGCREMPSRRCRAVGLPLSLSAGLESTFLGVGVEAFANLNGEATFAGLAVLLRLGWMP